MTCISWEMMADLIKISTFLTTHASGIPSRIASGNVTPWKWCHDKIWNEITTGHFIRTFDVCFLSIFIANFVQQTVVISLKNWLQLQCSWRLWHMWAALFLNGLELHIMRWDQHLETHPNPKFVTFWEEEKETMTGNEKKIKTNPQVVCWQLHMWNWHKQKGNDAIQHLSVVPKWNCINKQQNVVPGIIVDAPS